MTYDERTAARRRGAYVLLAYFVAITLLALMFVGVL